MPLGEVADIRLTQGATSIRTENAKLATYIFVDIRDRDLGGYVAAAQKAVAEQVQLPAGTYLVWSGQFEYLQRAEARLQVVVPVTLMIIFLLLYLNFRSLTETLIVMLSLPFALVGGIWLMWWLGFNLSVAVAVGFIALAGVAAETGVVMLIYLDHAVDEIRARCAARGTAVHARRPLRCHHDRRGRARAPEDDDGGRHHGRAAAHHVEHRHRLGGHAAHRRADDRRHGLVDAADPHRHSRDLRSGQSLEFASLAGGAITRTGSGSKCMMRREPAPTRHCWVAGRRRNRQTNAGNPEVRRCIAEAPAQRPSLSPGRVLPR